MNGSNLKYRLFQALTLLITASVAFGAAELRLNSRFMFCLNANVPPLEILRTADDFQVDLPSVNKVLKTYGAGDIEQWLPMARPDDRDGDVYLNRIYRVYIAEDRVAEMETMKSEIENLSVVHSTEYEYPRYTCFTPNDPLYWQQTSLPAVKANMAWDFWDIENGDLPGNREVIVAVIDTGTDYTHPDLMGNIWVNQNEIPNAMFNTLDADGDDYVDALEILAYLVDNNLDTNNDLEINLRDALTSASPLTNNIDDDNDGYTDDLFGWDVSGWTGSDDNDPYPKEDQPANSLWAHGTHVAGEAGLTTHNEQGGASSAFDVSIMCVKSSRDATNGGAVNDGYPGMMYAAQAADDNGTFAILNMSWGGAGYNGYEQNVVNDLFNNNNAVLVAAAGNGNDTGQEEYSSHYPSSYENVISVCAMGANGDWGHWATYHETVDLAAPGNDVMGPLIGGGWENWPGSSMASPNAASCIALLSSFYPTWDNQQLMDRIIESADPFIYEVNTDDYLQGRLGTGMVDVYYAIGGDVFPSMLYVGHTLTMQTGDGDTELNPGESAQLRITLGNEEGWVDATGIIAQLSTEHPGVTVTDGLALYADIASGDEGFNLVDPFAIELENSLPLGSVNFELQVTATGVAGYSYTRTLPFQIEVTINQQGWPVDSLYESINNIEVSPLVMDFTDSPGSEMVFGDYSGYLYMVTASGEMVVDDIFPFDTGNQIWGSPAAADIDNDDLVEIIATSKSKNLYILEPATGTVQVEYYADQYLMGSPALGNIDGDNDLEIIFGGYRTSGKLFVINPDGTDVPGFPYDVNEKILRGVSVADFNGNGLVDMVFATESDNIWLIYDDGTPAPGFPFTAGDKFKSAPAILDYNGGKIIFAGSRDFSMYALNSDGSLRFSVETSNYVNTSPAFVETGNGLGIFFGSEDGHIYGVDINGADLPGWPVEVNGAVNSSAVIADLDGDGIGEIMAGTAQGDVLCFHVDGTPYLNFPIEMPVPITGSGTAADLDGDGDVELLIGSSMYMLAFDIKETGTTDGFWAIHRGSNLRTGYTGDILVSGCDCQLGDLNCDTVVDILDIVRTVNIILTGGSDATECELQVADMNSDGIIDILDIVLIVNLVMGN